MNLKWLSAALALVLLTGCSQERGVAPDVSPDRPRTTEPAPPPEAPEPPPPPPPGSMTGGRLGASISERWPKVEQGMSGALQAIPSVLLESPNRLETRWLHVKKQSDLHRQRESLDRQRMDRRATADLLDLRAYEGRGLPPFGWRDRTRGRTHVTATMAAVLVRAYATFRAIYPDRRLSLGDLAQPGGGTLYHGTLVRELEGDAAQDVLNRSRLEGGRLVARSLRPATSFPRELHRFEAPDQRVEVEETILAQHSARPLRLRVAVRRYVESAVPKPDQAKEMIREANAIIRRGTLLSTTTLPYWSRDGARRLVRQHWVSPGTRGQLVVTSSRKQKRRLRVADLEEIRFSRFSARKPDSFQRERRWLPTRVQDGRKTRVEGWRRFTALYEAGHITHLTGRDADISYVTNENRSHFAVDIPNIDVVATWHWFEALCAAAREMGTEVEKILVDRSVLSHLKAGLPESALKTPLFTQILKRSGGHNAHHHLRLLASDRRSEAKGADLMSGLSERTLESLRVPVSYSVPLPATEAAARTPDDASASSPTPSK